MFEDVADRGREIVRLAGLVKVERWSVPSSTRRHAVDDGQPVDLRPKEAIAHGVAMLSRTDAVDPEARIENRTSQPAPPTGVGYASVRKNDPPASTPP